jgi:dienelactone hydrolase
MTSKSRWLTCFSLALLAVGVRLVGAEEAATPFRVSTVEFQSGGKRIRADHYEPTTSGPHPSVIVLHGAGGTFFDGPDMRRMSRDLATAGNDVFFVHYFNRTGTVFGLDAGMQRNFSTWLPTVTDAIKWVRGRHPGSGPIGVYGYSLGGFLAVAAGSDNPDVGAIVEQAGGLWNGNERLIGRMPPLLLVHGSEDKRVPFGKYAAPLASLLTKRGMQFQTQFVTGQGHVFTQPALVEVRQEVVKFFHRHLAARQKG